MFIFENIFVNKKLQKKKKKLEQDFVKKKITEKKENRNRKTSLKIKKTFYYNYSYNTYRKLDGLLTMLDGLGRVFVLSLFRVSIRQNHFPSEIKQIN